MGGQCFEGLGILVCWTTYFVWVEIGSPGYFEPREEILVPLRRNRREEPKRFRPVGFGSSDELRVWSYRGYADEKRPIGSRGVVEELDRVFPNHVCRVHTWVGPGGFLVFL